MKRVKHETTISIGEGPDEILIGVSANAEDEPERVWVEHGGGKIIDAPYLLIERVMAAISESHRVGFRSVCAEHGRYERKSTAYGCPKCGEEREFIPLATVKP